MRALQTLGHLRILLVVALLYDDPQAHVRNLLFELVQPRHDEVVKVLALFELFFNNVNGGEYFFDNVDKVATIVVNAVWDVVTIAVTVTVVGVFCGFLPSTVILAMVKFVIGRPVECFAVLGST